MPIGYTQTGDPLFSLSELATASDINRNILSRWIDNGDLKYFITVYKHQDTLCYKLGLPDEMDELLTIHPYPIYKAKLGKNGTLDPMLAGKLVTKKALKDIWF